MSNLNLAKVVFVDDDKRILEMVDEYFKLIKPTVNCFVFESPKEALKFIKQENIGIVLTDLKMPEMSGVDFLKEVKKIDNSIPVVIISAYATVSNAVDALKFGAEDVLLKPINLDSIKKIVLKYIDTDTNDNSDGKGSNNISEEELFLTYYLQNDEKTPQTIELFLKSILNSLISTFSLNFAINFDFRIDNNSENYFISSKNIATKEAISLCGTDEFVNFSILKDGNISDYIFKGTEIVLEYSVDNLYGKLKLFSEDNISDINKSIIEKVIIKYLSKNIDSFNIILKAILKLNEGINLVDINGNVVSIKKRETEGETISFWGYSLKN